MEMLAVLAIIGFLASVALAAVGAFGANAKDMRVKSDLRTIQNALGYHYIQTGSFPPAASWGQIDSPLLTPSYERMIDKYPEDPYGPGGTYGYVLRDQPGERQIYIAWSRKEPNTPVIYGDDRLYLYNVTLYVTNASKIATTVDEIECALGSGPSTPGNAAGSLLPLALLLLYLLTRRRCAIKQPCP